MDEIIDNKYIITNTITKYRKVSAQIVLKDLENNKIFKSKMFEMNFNNSINATEELNEEKELLIDKLILDIEQTFDRIEKLENDNIENKRNISKLENDKVDKIKGMGLSKNNFDDNYKNKLEEHDTEISNIKAKNIEQDNEIGKKLNIVQSNAFIKNVEYNSENAMFIFTAFDNTQIVVDLPIESTVKNGRYDDKTKELILVLVSGQEIKIPVTDLIDDYTGIETVTIQINVSADNQISANIIGGSITENLLSEEVIEKLNKTVDLTPYYTKTEINELLEQKDEEITELREKYNDIKKQLPERTSKWRIHTLKRL